MQTPDSVFVRCLIAADVQWFDLRRAPHARFLGDTFEVSLLTIHHGLFQLGFLRLVQVYRQQGFGEVWVAHHRRYDAVAYHEGGGDSLGRGRLASIRRGPRCRLFHDYCFSLVEDASWFEVDVRAVHPLTQNLRALSRAPGTAYPHIRMREPDQALHVTSVQGIVPGEDGLHLRAGVFG